MAKRRGRGGKPKGQRAYGAKSRVVEPDPKGAPSARDLGLTPLSGEWTAAPTGAAEVAAKLRDEGLNYSIPDGGEQPDPRAIGRKMAEKRGPTVEQIERFGSRFAADKDHRRSIESFNPEWQATKAQMDEVARIAGLPPGSEEARLQVRESARQRLRKAGDEERMRMIRERLVRRVASGEIDPESIAKSVASTFAGDEQEHVRVTLREALLSDTPEGYEKASQLISDAYQQAMDHHDAIGEQISFLNGRIASLDAYGRSEIRAIRAMGGLHEAREGV